MKLAPMTAAHAQFVARWQYEPPHNCYNCPPWAEMVTVGWGLTTEEGRWQMRAVLSEDGELVGYLRASPAAGGVRLGIGLAPEACGQGIGKKALALFFQELADKGVSAISLEVQSFNRRAIGCYEHMGLAADSAFLRDGVEYIRMTGTL